LEKLELRYQYLPTGFETPEDIQRRKQWEGPIRLRVINIVKMWLNKHYYDFNYSTELTKQLLSFVDKVISVTNERWADQLHLILQEQVGVIPYLKRQQV